MGEPAVNIRCSALGGDHSFTPYTVPLPHLAIGVTFRMPCPAPSSCWNGRYRCQRIRRESNHRLVQAKSVPLTKAQAEHRALASCLLGRLTAKFRLTGQIFVTEGLRNSIPIREGGSCGELQGRMPL